MILGGPPPAPMHECPPDGSGLMPCCGRTPFDPRPAPSPAGPVVVDVECEACRREVPFAGPNLADIDAQLTVAGWLSNKANDVDVCPSCVAGRVLAVGRNVSGVLL